MKTIHTAHEFGQLPKTHLVAICNYIEDYWYGERETNYNTFTKQRLATCIFNEFEMNDMLTRDQREDEVAMLGYFIDMLHRYELPEELTSIIEK
tara:strand:- start:648 stop:929 length:282 start_codon:yes stop_codon:yes gene_type:complete